MLRAVPARLLFLTMAYDALLAQSIREALLADHPAGFDERPMMGGLCFMVNYKMCVCLRDRRLMVRIAPEKIEEALQQPGCELMRHGGRTMKGFLWVHYEDQAEPKTLRSWIRLALEYNPHVPLSKEKEQRKKKQRATKKTTSKKAAKSTGKAAH